MNLKFEQTGSRAIVYDADCMPQPGRELFDAEYWRRTGAISATAPGRGNALMLETPFGSAVMRAYLRGGWAARLSHDRYLFTGFDRCRPLAEARMLAELTRMGLPVPQPLAAQCRRHGLAYTGVLLTRRIMPAVPLADLLADGAHLMPDWFLIGRCIRRFHDAGVVHPDLNARNILLGENGGGQDDIYLIDFDRAFFCHGSRRWFRANLGRLRRSLLKSWPAGRAGELRACWEQLINGYNSAAGRSPPLHWRK
jgi:3-deoxy-D-manno-octulosonic acid kinase